MQGHDEFLQSMTERVTESFAAAHATRQLHQELRSYFADVTVKAMQSNPLSITRRPATLQATLKFATLTHPHEHYGTLAVTEHHCHLPRVCVRDLAKRQTCERIALAPGDPEMIWPSSNLHSAAAWRDVPDIIDQETTEVFSKPARAPRWRFPAAEVKSPSSRSSSLFNE